MNKKIYQEKSFKGDKRIGINYYIAAELKVFCFRSTQIFTLRYQNLTFFSKLLVNTPNLVWPDPTQIPHPYPCQCCVDTFAAPKLPSPSILAKNYFYFLCILTFLIIDAALTLISSSSLIAIIIFKIFYISRMKISKIGEVSYFCGLVR